MRRVLNIGPNVTKSYGGMVTVINQIKNSKRINNSFKVDIFETYIDGNVLKRLVYSFFQCLKFKFSRQWKKYDLFHIHMASNMSTYRKMWLCKILRKHNKPFVIHIHGAEYEDFYKSQSIKNQKRITDFLNSAQKVIVLSNFWKELFENDLKVNNCLVLNNCIDNELYFKCFKQNIGETISFLYLGRIGQRKGIWDLVESIRMLNRNEYHLKVFVAGDGEISTLNSVVTKYDLNDIIEVVGWADQKKKEELLSKTDVLVLPSYNEGLPMSILEAMAAGKLIISTSVGSIPEVVKNRENGYIINPGDILELKNRLEMCFDKANLRVIQKNNIKLIQKEYSISRFEDSIIEIYDEII